MTKNIVIRIRLIQEVPLNKKCTIWWIIWLMWVQLVAKSRRKARFQTTSHQRRMRALRIWSALLEYLSTDQEKSTKDNYLTEKDLEKEKWLFQMVISISATGVSIKCVTMMASITSEMETNIKDNTKPFQTSTECAMAMDNSKLLD